MTRAGARAHVAAGQRFSRALVTGASAGIGREIASQLAGDGVDLVLVARREAELEELAGELRGRGVQAEVLVADLTDPEDLQRVQARLVTEDAPVDLLVNNAGYGTFGQFASLDPDREAGQVELNVLALVRLSRAAAGAMVSRGAGGILNVGSVAGLQPLPGNATYAATKAFVNSFSQALHEELKPTGVHCTVLAPGFTRTEFQDTAGVGETSSKVPSVMWMEAGPVARAGIDGVAANKALVLPGVLNRVNGALLGVAPDAVTRRVAGAVIRRFGG